MPPSTSPLVHASPDILGASTVAEINVCKIQVATYCDNRGPSSVLGIVSRLADKVRDPAFLHHGFAMAEQPGTRQVNTEDQDSLSSLVSDVALALLRFVASIPSRQRAHTNTQMLKAGPKQERERLDQRKDRELQGGQRGRGRGEV